MLLVDLQGHHFFVRRRIVGRQLPGNHRHPGINSFHLRAGANLPCHSIKQVTTHWDVAVWKIDKIGCTVCIRVSKRLEVDGVDIDSFDPLKQFAEIFVKLLWVRIVDVIKVNMHRLGSLRVIGEIVIAIPYVKFHVGV